MLPAPSRRRWRWLPWLLAGLLGLGYGFEYRFGQSWLHIAMSQQETLQRLADEIEALRRALHLLPPGEPAPEAGIGTSFSVPAPRSP